MSPTYKKGKRKKSRTPKRTPSPFNYTNPGFIGPALPEIQEAINYAENRLLFIAVEMGDLAEARKALNDGADVNSRDEQGNTPLMRAFATGHLEIAKLLQKYHPKK